MCDRQTAKLAELGLTLGENHERNIKQDEEKEVSGNIW